MKIFQTKNQMLFETKILKKNVLTQKLAELWVKKLYKYGTYLNEGHPSPTLRPVKSHFEGHIFKFCQNILLYALMFSDIHFKNDGKHFSTGAFYYLESFQQL